MRKCISMMVVCAVLSGCGGDEVPADLERAAAIIEQFAVPMQLQNSMFSAAFPECKASEFVRYMFSDLASAELPMREGMAREGDREEAEAIGMHLWPDSVAISEQVPHPNKGRQIVLTFDDSRNTVILHLYVDPLKDPVRRTEFTVHKVVPTEIARISFQSNVELGAKY